MNVGGLGPDKVKKNANAGSIGNLRPTRKWAIGTGIKWYDIDTTSGIIFILYLAESTMLCIDDNSNVSVMFFLREKSPSQEDSP